MSQLPPSFLRASLFCRTSELVPKYTAQDSEEGLVPDVLHVMGCMVDEYAAV